MRKWREARDISQIDFAKRVGIKQPHLSAIENGEGVSLEVAVKIFNETGVRVGKLKNATARQVQTIAALVAA